MRIGRVNENSVYHFSLAAQVQIVGTDQNTQIISRAVQVKVLVVSVYKKKRVLAIKSNKTLFFSLKLKKSKKYLVFAMILTKQQIY